MSAPRIINPATASGGVPVGGSGAAGYVAKWTAATTLGGSATTGATASLYVDATGQVGIGTASPTHKLQVVGELGLYNAGVDAVYGDVLFMGASPYQTTFRHKIKASVSATSVSSLMTFSLTSGASTFIDVMTLRGDGSVGIGTASPTAGRSLTTAADCDIFGLRIGRGLLSEANSTALGASALNATVVGALNNTAVGSNAGKLLTTGVANTFAGYQSGFGTTTGGQNTYFGYSIATGSTSTGSRNTAIGGAALAGISSGSDNVIVGYTAAGALATGTNNIIIGASANTSGAAVTNEIVIGASVTGAGSNTTTIGTTATTKTVIPAGTLQLPASTTARASLNITSGVAPTAPNNGDIWFDGTNIFMRVGGVTKTFTLV